MNKEKTEIIDFHAKFMQDFLAWSNKHPEIASDEEKLELAAERAEEKWYSSKKSWLGDISPNEYFLGIKDAAKYISLLISYIEEGRSIPSPLMDCIIGCGDEAYSIITNLLSIEDSDDLSDDTFNEVRAELIGIIDELRREHPYSAYITLILRQTEANELTEALSNAFMQAEDIDFVRDLLLSSYPISHGFSRMMILDILCSFPDDDMRTADLVLKELASDELELSVVAGYEATLMDERALPLLRNYLEDPSIDYYTYTELRFAIEAITGELIEEKDFTGDDDYDKIAGLKEEDIFG